MQSETRKIPRKRLKRKRFLFTVVIIVLFGLIYLGWRSWSNRGYEKAAGIYITTGGESYLTIQSGTLGSLKIVKGIFILNERSLSRGDMNICETSAQYRNNVLTLTQKETYYTQSTRYIYMKDSPYWGPSFIKSYCVMTLKPSPKILGDWDLIDAKITIREGGARLFSFPEYRNYLKKSPSIKDFRKRLSIALRSKESLLFELEPAKSPYPSFLHKIRDHRVSDYFSRRLADESSENTLEIIRDLVEDHPDDPYIQIHLVEQETLMGNLENAERLLIEWKKKNSPCPDIFLGESSQKVERLLSMARIKETDPDIVNIFKHSGMSKNLEQRRELFLSLFESNKYIYPRDIITPPVMKPGYPERYLTNYWDLFITIRVMRTLAILDLFLGKRGESLELLAASYWFAQCLNSSGTTVQRFLASLYRGDSVSSLIMFLLNSCETEEDFQKFLTIMRRLRETEGRWKSMSIFDGDFPLLPSQMNISGEALTAFEDMETRVGMYDVKFQLLLLATAAKYELEEQAIFRKPPPIFPVIFLMEFLTMNFPKETPFDLRSLRMTNSSFTALVRIK